MIAVLFEVEPAEGKADAYFDLAASLRDELMETEGFISVERFESLTTVGKFLSMSYWEDRDAVELWYANSNHSRAQQQGRNDIFKNYRIRVAEVFRDYDMAAGRPDI